MPAHFVLTSSRAVYGEGEWIADGSVYRPVVRTHHQLERAEWDPISPSGAPGRPLPSVAGSTPARTDQRLRGHQTHTGVHPSQLDRWHGECTNCPAAPERLRRRPVARESLHGSPLTLHQTCSLSGDPSRLRGREHRRDFVYIEDVVSALASAIRSVASGNARLVDVGSGTPTTIGEVAHAIAGMAGAPKPKVTGQYNDGDVRAARTTSAPRRDPARI